MIDAGTNNDRITMLGIAVDGAMIAASPRGEFTTNTTEYYNGATNARATDLAAGSTHTVSLVSCSNGNSMSVLNGLATITAVATP
jgi:hypothetical protein